MGRQGLSVSLNRSRQPVIGGVKGTGAVLMPTKLFNTSKIGPEYVPYSLGGDKEVIYPFQADLASEAKQSVEEVP